MKSPDDRPILVAMVAATAVLAAGALATSPPVWPGRALVFWLAACTLSELLWVRLPLGAATVSMSSCFNFAALLLLPRAGAMLAAGLSVAVAESVFMRKRPIRVAFNSAQTALAVAAGSLVFSALGGTPAFLALMVARLQLAPFLAAGLAYSLVNTGAVSMAVAASEGTSPVAAWQENFGNSFELAVRGALLTLGLVIAVLFPLIGPLGSALAAVPLVTARRAYARRLARLAPRPPRLGARTA